MTNEESIRILHEESCAYCSWGASSPDNCDNDDCDVKAALNLAIAALERDRWISEMPDESGWYWVVVELVKGEKEIFPAYYDAKYNEMQSIEAGIACELFGVTAVAPMWFPEPPKEER